MKPGETTVLIPLLLDAGRIVRANLTFDAGLLDAIDEAANPRLDPLGVPSERGAGKSMRNGEVR